MVGTAVVGAVVAVAVWCGGGCSRHVPDSPPPPR